MHTLDKVLRVAACSMALLGSAAIRAAADPAAPSATGTLVAEPESDQPAEMIGRGYFALAVDGGQERSVRIAVQNTSAEPMPVRAYGVDGVPVTGGGIAFTTFDQPVEGPGTWVSVDSPNLELAPGELRRLTATIKVADGATPGDHVAGIAIENARPRPSSNGDSQVVINVFYRRAIAVVVAVPGARTTALEVDTVALSQEAQGNRATLRVRNTGNSLFKAKGTLEIGGSQASSVPLSFLVDTLIPGTETGIPVPLPSMKLGPGTYAAHVVMQTDDGRPLADWQGSAVFAARPQGEPTVVPATMVSLAPLDAAAAAPRATSAAVVNQVAPAAGAATLSDQDAAALARQAGATSSAGFWLLGILVLLLVVLRTAFVLLARRKR